MINVAQGLARFLTGILVLVFKRGPVIARSMPYWCIGNPGGDPFGEKVLKILDSLRLTDILVWAAEQGLIEMTSAHDDDLVPWDPAHPGTLTPDDRAQIEEIRRRLDKAGIKFHMMTCNLHAHPLFQRGGLTNPNPAVREIARQKAERALLIGNLLGAIRFTYWVARDGFEVSVKAVDDPFQLIADALNHARAYMKQMGFENYRQGTIEPKPNEPRGHMWIATAGHAVGLIQTKLKERQFWGVNPELMQHEGMTLLDAVSCVKFLVSCGKLFFLHFGNQIKGQFDNDFPPLVGPEHLKETVEMFRVLKVLGWKGVVEFDCHMLRCEADPEADEQCRQQFIRNCSTALTIALELAERQKGLDVSGMKESEADLAAIMAMTGLDPAEVAAKTSRAAA